MKNEISHFVDCSIKEKEIAFPPSVGARAVEMIEISMASINAKKTINVDKYLNGHS